MESVEQEVAVAAVVDGIGMDDKGVIESLEDAVADAAEAPEPYRLDLAYLMRFLDEHEIDVDNLASVEMLLLEADEKLAADDARYLLEAHEDGTINGKNAETRKLQAQALLGSDGERQEAVNFRNELRNTASALKAVVTADDARLKTLRAYMGWQSFS